VRNACPHQPKPTRRAQDSNTSTTPRIRQSKAARNAAGKLAWASSQAIEETTAMTTPGKSQWSIPSNHRPDAALGLEPGIRRSARQVVDPDPSGLPKKQSRSRYFTPHPQHGVTGGGPIDERGAPRTARECSGAHDSGRKERGQIPCSRLHGGLTSSPT
jgi:hypothetical protein